MTIAIKVGIKKPINLKYVLHYVSHNVVCIDQK